MVITKWLITNRSYFNWPINPPCFYIPFLVWQVLFGLVSGIENQFTPRRSTFGLCWAPASCLCYWNAFILSWRFGLLPLSMTSTWKARSTSRSLESKAQVSVEIKKFIPIDPVPSLTKPPTRVALKNQWRTEWQNALMLLLMAVQYRSTGFTSLSW